MNASLSLLPALDEIREFCKQVACDWLGDGGLVDDTEPATASEDFAFFLEKVPDCHVFIGNGVGSEGGCMVHNAGYDFNDRVLSTGASYWVRLAEAYLKKSSSGFSTSTVSSRRV
jgi:hippurate hydrolase